MAFDSYLSRQLGDLRVGLIVGQLQTAGLERVGVLAGSAVQLQLRIGLDLDRRGSHQFVVDRLVERRPERLVRDFGVGEPVHGRVGRRGPQVAVVVVDLHHLRRVDLLAEREQHALELVVVDEVGLGLVVAEAHACDRSGRELRPTRVTADIGEPR